jgi:hypothetical protein
VKGDIRNWFEGNRDCAKPREFHDHYNLIEPLVHPRERSAMTPIGPPPKRMTGRF